MKLESRVFSGDKNIFSLSSIIKLNETGGISEMFISGYKNMKRGNDNMYVYKYTIYNIPNYDCNKADSSKTLQYLSNLVLRKW